MAVTAPQRAILNDDILRLALVKAVAALDRYAHDRVTKRIIAAYKTSNLTKEQEEFSIPVSLAIKITEKASAAKKANKQARPANLVRNQIQEILHKRPFQSWREIEMAFSLIGITGLSGSIQAARHLPNFQPFKSEMNSIMRTRNLIVHEGHIRRHQRGGKPTLIEIETAYVTGAINFIKALVNDLESVT